MTRLLNTHQLARIALVALLVVGCFMVMRPFLAAILFATVICVFTWPLYHRLWQWMRQRDTFAALMMTLLLLVALILPMTYLAANLADVSKVMLDELQSTMASLQPDPPPWLGNMPIVGSQISAIWSRAAGGHDELMRLLQQFYEPMRQMSLQGVQLFISGVLQLALAVFVAFFFYRDGAKLARGLTMIAIRLGGELGREMLTLSSNTVKGVMLGIFGTALAQATVGLIGFAVAGAPMPFLLALATFFLSVIPVGPPLVWGGAAVWLFNHGDHGWAIFLALYGFLVISTVDNVLKPILISHTSHLPLLLVVLGVLGGAIAFGFVGIFLGPTLLAVGLTLVAHWIALQQTKEHKQARKQENEKADESV